MPLPFSPGHFDLLPRTTKAEYLLAHAAFNRTSGSSHEALLALNERHGAARARLDGLQAPSEGYRRGVPELPVAYHGMHRHLLERSPGPVHRFHRRAAANP
jgi:hypothetical protein